MSKSHRAQVELTLGGAELLRCFEAKHANLGVGPLLLVCRLYPAFLTRHEFESPRAG